MKSSEQILEKSTKGASILMLAQLFTKLVNFALNSLLIRSLSPRIFGITAFLEFILSTCLFFSREAIRISTLRIKENPNESEGNILQMVVNFSHIPMWIGLPLSTILTSWQYRNVNAYFVSLPFFTTSIVLIWFSIIIELLSEPFYVLNQFLLNYGTRSKVISVAVTMGCLINFLVIMAYEKKWVAVTAITDNDETMKEGIAILAFALSKFTHALVLLIYYYYDYHKNFASQKLVNFRLTELQKLSVPKEVPVTSQNTFYFQPEILEHFKKVYFQMCFKHLLTEGDKLVINSLCTVEEQGIYSLLSNYGSLITRLLFQPIEESLRSFLARLLSNTRNSKNLRLSMAVLVNLTKFYLYLSILIIVFGPVNSSFLLQFLIGLKWSTTSVLDTIKVYCVYLPFLSVNGIFEAFFQSTASGDQILRHSYMMMGFSGIFLLNCYILIHVLELSISGLIVSNIFNMSLRISYCGWYIHKFYKELYSETSSFILNFNNLISPLVAGFAIGSINWYFIGSVKNFNQFFANVALAMMMLCSILYKERNVIKDLLGNYRISGAKNK